MSAGLRDASARVEVPVTSVEARAYRVPTDRPGGRRHPDLGVHHPVVVLVRSRGGRLGTGWTYAPAATVGLVDELLAAVVCGARRPGPGRRAAGDVARGPQRGPPGPRRRWRSPRSTSRCGTCAPGCRPCRSPGCGAPSRTVVEVYGSGGFTTYDDDRRCAPAGGLGELGLRRVKIKIGESWGTEVVRDLDPYRAGAAHGRRTTSTSSSTRTAPTRAGQACRMGARPGRPGRDLVRGAGHLRRPGRAAPGPGGGRRPTSPPASTATTCPTSSGWPPRARSTACRST